MPETRIMQGLGMFVGLVPLVSACDFAYDTDPYTQYFGLSPDYTAYSAYDCEQRCCDDAGCGVWQYTDQYNPSGGANCMYGIAGGITGDSGGIYWQGADGRVDPGGNPPSGPPPAGHKLRKKGEDAPGGFGELFLMIFAVFGGLYLVGGTYYGVKTGKTGLHAIPNVDMWVNLMGLVKDGVSFSTTGAKPPPSSSPTERMLLGLPSSSGSTLVSHVGAASPMLVVQGQPAAVGGSPRVRQDRALRADGKRVRRVKKSTAAAAAAAGGAAAGAGSAKQVRRVKKVKSLTNAAPSAASSLE